MTVTAKPPYPPRLADGVELLGDFKDSGYDSPPSLVRRPDGQVIQLSRLLYLLARQLDGRRDPVDIADQLGGDLGLELTPGQICTLIVAKLAPLGIVAGQQTAEAGPPTAAPLLGLRARGTLVPARATYAIGTALRPLFYRPVVAAVIAAVVALDCWMLSVDGLAGAFGQLMNNPADLLLLAVLTLASAAFHECGHAAACRYGGATPGRIGFGIYLVWPSFFTDVTDSYRLDRTGRLRTDLGGVYFNLVFMLLLAGGYALTGAPLLLLVIALGHLEVLQQMLPFVRFDGYFIMSDLVGVPDLFSRVLPTLLRGARRDPRAPRLRGRAQTIATCWVLCVIPLLICTIGYMLLRLPAANRALWLSAGHSAGLAVSALADHRYAAAGVSAVGTLLAALSVAGSVYLVLSLVRRVITTGRRWSAGRQDRLQVVVVAGLGFVVCLVALWVTQGEFRGW